MLPFRLTFAFNHFDHRIEASLVRFLDVASRATATFVAPPVEEAAKALGLLAIYLFSKRRVPESHGPLSGVVYGGIIGLGFTLTEDVIYIVQMSNAQGAGAGAALFFVRTILLGFGHASFTAFVGLGFGLWAVMSSGWRWVMPLAGLAVGMAFARAAYERP